MSKDWSVSAGPCSTARSRAEHDGHVAVQNTAVVHWWEKHRVSGTITAITVVNVVKMWSRCWGYHLYFSKGSPLILSNKGHRFRGNLLLHCQALSPAVSVGFIPSSPDNPPSPEAWDTCEAEPERRTTTISSCYLSGKRSLLSCAKHMHNRL